VAEALVELRGATSFLKVLGSYPIEDREKTVPSVKTLVTQPDEPATAGAEAPRGTPVQQTNAEALASRDASFRATRLRIGSACIGGAEIVIMAGPNAVESDEQILACARHIKECGGQILCGGCFQTPASPGGFAGLGWDGLAMLAEAGRRYGLPILTEVLSPADVQRVAELADVLLIGPQNMHNYPLLSEVGSVHRAVLLKRGRAASLEQLLDAAEYIMGCGNQQVMLCEHGISTFETTTRNTLDLGGISILKQRTHLPIVADPSHAAGQRDLVLPLALAARAVGTHALMVEVHPDPGRAIGDATQSLRFEDFRHLVAQLHR
jgi:chorismate mutase/prephenate dehydratase